MKKCMYEVYGYVFSAIFGMCVFLFFWRLFPYHLHFQEQFQLFLFTKSYFFEVCSRPGGFCNYIGRFLTQFYISSFFGAVLMSCLLVGIQQLTHAVAERFLGNRLVEEGVRSNPERIVKDQKDKQAGTSLRLTGLLLSFLPSLIFWYYLCDENTQTAGAIALIFTLLIALAGARLKSVFLRWLYLFIGIPVFYWLAGGTIIVSIILLSMFEWRCRRAASGKIRMFWLSVLSAICFVFILPVITKIFLPQYLLYRYWWGVDYVHFVNYSSFFIIYIWLSIILVVLGKEFLAKIEAKKNQTTKSARAIQSKYKSLPWLKNLQVICFSGILLLAIYFVILKSAYQQNFLNEEVMAYDYHCRMMNWDQVVMMANRKAPTFPITVACLNLALYQTGKLPDKMFHYFQNGPEGLLPSYQRDFLIPMVGSEPYWRLGLVNTAQRFAFEAMEAFPNNQKSVRSIKRLVETNLVNGHYEVASKYLYWLEHTLFYRKWAKDTRTFLYDEAKINTHHEWGKIRRFRTGEDFLFDENAKDAMLRIIFEQHPDNRMAFEYLMAYALLTNDTRNFVRYFQLAKDFNYHEIPQSYQEAFAYLASLKNDDTDEAISLQISETVRQQFQAYIRIYTSTQSPEPLLRKQFQHTYWYYYHFRKVNQINIEQSLHY